MSRFPRLTAAAKAREEASTKRSVLLTVLTVAAKAREDVCPAVGVPIPRRVADYRTDPWTIWNPQ